MTDSEGLVLGIIVGIVTLGSATFLADWLHKLSDDGMIYTHFKFPEFILKSERKKND